MFIITTTATNRLEFNVPFQHQYVYITDEPQPPNKQSEPSGNLHSHQPQNHRDRQTMACSRTLLFSDSTSSLKVPSVLWGYWLGGRKSIQPVKSEWWVTGVVISLQRGANDLHMVQLRPLPPPSSLAPVKSRIVYRSGAGLPGGECVSE